MANRLRQQQQQQRQQHQLQQHPQQQLHHPQQAQAPPQPQRQRSLPPSSELFASSDRLSNINLPPNLRNSFQQQQQQLHLQNRAAQGVAQAAAAQSAVAGLLQGGVHGNGSSSNITATGSVAGAGAAPPSSTQPLPQGIFPPQGSGRNAFEHYSNVYASAWGGGGAPQQSQQHRQWQQQQQQQQLQQQQQQQQQQLQQLQHQLRGGMRAARGSGRGGGSEFVGGHVASATSGRVARTTGYGGTGSIGSYAAVPLGTEVVEVLDDDRATSPPAGVDTNRQLFNQQQQRQQQQQQQRQQQREQQQRVVLAAAPGVRIPAVPQRREDRGLPRPLDEHLHPIMPATAPGSNNTNAAQRGQPTGAALLRLLAAGQPHWYIGQEALPTGDCKTLLYIPELDRRPRMGVACESMSLKLLTGQARLVEALAGMYMKSINFFADEGRGEFPIPGAPQAFLPYERALYAAGMRDGDVVTLVDGLPATQGTLAKLGAKAHSQCSQPCVACVRLTFLRPVGSSPTMPLASPQSVIDRWREFVRIIVLDSVPESPRKQEVLEQLERLQDASTLRTLACHSFEGQLEVARSNAGRRTRSSIPEQGPRQQQLQLQQPQQYVLNSNVSSSNPSSAAPAAIATRPIVAQAGDHQQHRQQQRGVPAILSIGDNVNSNANGHAGGAEGFLSGARAGADDLEQASAAEAAPSAFVLRRLGSDKGSDKGGVSRAGMRARDKVENGGAGSGDGGVGDHARGVERSSSAKEPSAKEPSAREGEGGGDDNFSVAELAFVQEHWQDGVCTLHHPEDGVAGGEVQDASGALALRRLVKCWGVDVKVGMTKAQLEADLRKAAKNGTLPDSGSFSYDIPEIVAAPSSQTQATVEAATASSLAVEGGEMEPSSSEQWCVEGQIVWVRGAFVAYMDGQAIEDNDVWCPGLVCVKMADPESGEGKGDPEAGSTGFVVDVLGQSQAEFEVEGDNLTGFPGHGENLETVRESADCGLGSPPDHMSLAVGQAILACLKCGWDAERGTNILRPTLCNDQDQGDARVKTYAKAWGIDPVKLEDLLKLSWQLMRPVPRGQESARRDHESGDWEHLRATWRKIERMWRGASSVEHLSAGGSSNSSSGGAKSVREVVLAEGVAADGSAEGKAAMPSGNGSHEEEKGEGVQRNGGVAVATVMPSKGKGREGEEEGGDAGGTRALSDKPGRSSPSQTGDGEATSPLFREGSESARESDGGDRRGESKEIAEGASNYASAKDTGGKGRPASPSAPAGSAGHGESSAADSNPLPSPFLLPPPPPPHPVGSSASDGDPSGADAAGAAGAAGAIETNRATVAAQGQISSLPSDGAGVTGRTALKRSANGGKEGEEGGGAGKVSSERDAKRAKVGPTKSIEGSTARTASPGTTNSSSRGGGGSGSDAHSTTVTATGAFSNAAGDATGDLEPDLKVAGEVGATAVTSVPGGDSSGGSCGLASMRNSIHAKGNGETASDGGGKQYALPTSTETVEAAAEKLAGPATAAGEAAAAPKGADGFTTPAERAIAGADAPTPMAGSPASDDRARPTSGSQAGSKNKDVVSRPSGVPGEKAVRDPSSMPGGSNSPAALPLPPRKISTASGEASGVADGEEDRRQPWRGSAETLPRRGRKFETPPEFNENDFRDRTPRANGGHGVRVA